MGMSCFHQSLLPSSCPSFLFISHIKNAENKKKNAKSMNSLRHQNPSENNFCKRRSILFVGFSSLPFLQLRASAIEGLLKEEQNVSMPRERNPPRPENLRNEEEVHQGEAQPNLILALLNVLGIFGSGVLGALYALAQKEKTATEATIESMKTKLSEKEAAMALLKMNYERNLLNEQEERAKKFSKAKEEQQSLLNQLTLANGTVKGLGQELRSEKRLVEELKSKIDKLQKEKLDSIEVLQKKINLLTLEIKDKEDNV